ncbi:MAG: LysM peptidoglycan-binding domain-containing protein [Mailhella sp.]|nr:LysM peptidoglycan-binding domain-containing protein [Mailhella sp.]
MKISDMCRFPLFGIAALLILSGCSMERVGAPELVPTGSPYSSSDIANIELTEAEKAVFKRAGVLDRRLEPSMEAMVRYHFVKYSREKRVTMQHFLRNSLPYLNYAKAVFRSKGLPEDLAYLAYLESGYKPLAVSRSRATGLWQFISSTGKIYGLSQDWWMDERMDPYRSTHAAAEYLSRLHDIFQDWHLAIASYNGGEGAVGRAQKAAHADGLNALLRKNSELDPAVQLREETRLYVPRFLAILKIMRAPEALGLKALPPDAQHPVLLPVVELKAKPATDLAELARRIGMPWKEFLAYNPHFLRSISPANRQASVYVPQGKQEQARKLLQGTVAGIGWRYHTVKKGETIAKVSDKVGIPASVIRQLNPGKFKRGLRLRLPAGVGSVPPFKPMVPSYEPEAVRNAPSQSAAASFPAAAVKAQGREDMPSEYEVRKGDTLSGIAEKFGCSVKDIQLANGGADKVKSLRIGQVISLPSAEWQAEEAKKPVERRTHKVKSGETLSAIALKNGCTVKQLYAENGGQKKLRTLRVGQVLYLPYTPEQLDEIERRKELRLKQAAEARKAAVERAKATADSARERAMNARVTTHTVEKGDSLSRIARKYGTTVAELQQANGGADRLKTLRIGQVIKLPQAGIAPQAESVPVKEAPKPAMKAGTPAFHAVESGDSLSRIARKYGTTVAELQQANGGADKLKTLRIGQKLALPGAKQAEAEPVSDAAAALSELRAEQASPVPVKSAPAKGQPENYAVQPGDTIWAITHRFGMSEAEFKKLNPSVSSSSLRVGASIKIIRKK